MRVYIATRLERAADHQRLAALLRAAGHEITYDWTVHGSVQSEGPERIRDVAVAEARGVQEADCVIVLLPGGRGTHTELGMALAFGRPCIVAAEHAHGFFGDDGRTCAFYHHPLVRRVEGGVADVMHELSRLTLLVKGVGFLAVADLADLRAWSTGEASPAVEAVPVRA
jgi:hypothetical protein